jgi:hypothetical protein
MMNPSRNVLAGILLVLIVVAASAYYLSEGVTRTTTTTQTTTLFGTKTETFTTSIIRNFTTTYLSGLGLEIVSVKANPTSIPGTGNYSLLFIVVWRNVSNVSLYYATGCGTDRGAEVSTTLLPTSTAKVGFRSAGTCLGPQSNAELKPGANATSYNSGPSDDKAYVLTSGGRLDTNLTLHWFTSRCYPICQSNSMSFAQSFEL